MLFTPVLITGVFLLALSLSSGCARKGEEEVTTAPAPSKTLLEFKLTVAGNISTFDGSYVVALDTDGDFSTGPYVTVSDTTVRFSNFKTGFMLDKGTFKRIQYDAPSDTIQTVPASPSTFSISGGMLTVSWDPIEFGSPGKIDINVFTWKQADNNITIIDGLGDPFADRDAKAIHMHLNSETEKSTTDAADDVPAENANFNIIAFSVKKITS